MDQVPSPEGHVCELGIEFQGMLSNWLPGREEVHFPPAFDRVAFLQKPPVDDGDFEYPLHPVAACPWSAGMGTVAKL